MHVETKYEPSNSDRIPGNKGKLVGPNPPLKHTEIWAIRIRLQLAGRVRDTDSRRRPGLVMQIGLRN